MTSYPRNFGAMLHAFLDGWKPNQETIDFQHMDKRVDPETGRKTTIHGPWVPCKSLRDLIRLAQVWPIWDNYITVQRFTKWETRGRESFSDHDSYVLDRIYTDEDPVEGVQDCLANLPKYRRMQDDLEVSGRSCVWITSSGRGIHSYTYLTRPVNAKLGQELQDILGYVYNLNLDYWKPITRAGMMRLPYSKNSRTGTWVLYVGRNMTLSGIRNAMRSTLEGDGCHWDYPARIPPERILEMSPGESALKEYREKKREQALQKIKRNEERRVAEITALLNEGKTLEQAAAELGFVDARYVRRWTNVVDLEGHI